MTESLAALLTALADDELVIGHRHSEWTGYAPHLEEDIAFSSIAQDEIGHAAAYYSLLGKLTGDEPDALALGRSKDDYRHAVICERPNGDWAYTLARHWLYDTADDIRLQALETSANDELAALATKIRREERYHLIHADSWIGRVAKGPVEGRTKLMDAIGVAFGDAVALFEPMEQEDAAIKEGWLPTPSDEMRRRFLDRTGVALDELGLPTQTHAHAAERAEFVASSSGDLIDTPAEESTEVATADGIGGRRGRHTSDFDSLWSDMTAQYRAHPGASW
ncbi:MAG TPA: 1,2-phenylacetyl-CoA epoxidase subunit PaaC [Actinomycetota bacterium]|nr:1,2-phenylacetyl-CoA epoxidase subunit PaaC [Actinomycetota bacterium]